MSTHRMILGSLVTAFALSLPTVASAHVFRMPQTKAEIAAERAAACRAAARPQKPTVARFGPPASVTTGASYRVAGMHRFGGGRHVPAVACTTPVKARYVGCR